MNGKGVWTNRRGEGGEGREGGIKRTKRVKDRWFSGVRKIDAPQTTSPSEGIEERNGMAELFNLAGWLHRGIFSIVVVFLSLAGFLNQHKTDVDLSVFRSFEDAATSSGPCFSLRNARKWKAEECGRNVAFISTDPIRHMVFLLLLVKGRRMDTLNLNQLLDFRRPSPIVRTKE